MTAPFLGAGDRAVQFVAGALGLVAAGFVAGATRHLSGGTLLAIGLAVGGLLLLADACRGRDVRRSGQASVKFGEDTYVDPVLVLVACADGMVAVCRVPSAEGVELTAEQAAGVLRRAARNLLEQPDGGPITDVVDR